MAQIVLSLGSNLGSPKRQLAKAVRKIRKLGYGCMVSDAYRYLPVDCPDGSPDFYNLIIALSAKCSAQRLFVVLQRLENAHGRRRRIYHGKRTLDCDICYAQYIRLRDKNLILPHPHAASREFVQEPLSTLPLRSSMLRCCYAVTRAGRRRVRGVNLGRR